jgi:quercetin dioxygenase-like cupin family protein
MYPAEERAWQIIGSLVPSQLAELLDPGELASTIALHDPGGPTEPELIELRLEPGALIVPHSHDGPEIFYVAAGEILVGQRRLEAGSSLTVPAGCGYSFRAGPEGARLVEFRPTADRSFHPRG